MSHFPAAHFQGVHLQGVHFQGVPHFSPLLREVGIHALALPPSHKNRSTANLRWPGWFNPQSTIKNQLFP